MTARAFVRVALSGGLFAAVAGLTTLAGYEPVQPPAGDKPANIQANVAGCVRCHYGANEGDAGGFAESEKYVRLNESKVWKLHDPHSLAFLQIVPEKNPTAARMQTVLRKGKPPGYRIDSDPLCLSCHATDKDPTSGKPRVATEFVSSENIGVGCTACHGLDARWQIMHYSEQPAPGTNFPSFRMRPAKEKRDFGLHNLRNPAGKAALCASCHVGNPDEGKQVTHEMYAAGHPPLPPFELATFIEAEPRHWGYPSEMPFLADLAKSDKDGAWNLFHVRDEAVELSAARNIAVGAIASLKAEMAGLAAEATLKLKGGLLDFARFDCYACHHDLVIPSTRQEAGYAGVPGRPPLKAWVSVVPGVVAKHAAAHSNTTLKVVAGGFDAKWKAVADAALARPFGDPAATTAAANGLKDWCYQFLAAVEKDVIYTQDETAKLADALAAAAVDPKTLRDPEAVAHVTWAYASLDFAVKKDAGRRDAILALSPLKLPDREKSKSDKPITVGAILDERMKLFREFDSRAFAKRFAEVK